MCRDCCAKGQVSYLPALRACDSCLEELVKCHKPVILVVVTDCTECNKQALLELYKMPDDNNFPPELLLMVPIPDVVQIGKSLKCSLSNWFINLNRQEQSQFAADTARFISH